MQLGELVFYDSFDAILHSISKCYTAHLFILDTTLAKERSPVGNWRACCLRLVGIGLD